VAKVEALILAAAAFDGRSGVGGEFCSTCVRTLGRGCGQKYLKLSEATFCNWRRRKLAHIVGLLLSGYTQAGSVPNGRASHAGRRLRSKSSPRSRVTRDGSRCYPITRDVAAATIASCMTL
jgi:hypothetical protein